MLAPALRGDIADRPFQNLEKSLLDPLAGNVACDADVLSLAPDLIDFIHVNDALLGLFDVEVRGLKEAQDDVLHIFAHVAGLGQRRRIHDTEGDIQNAGKGAGEQRLS